MKNIISISSYVTACLCAIMTFSANADHGPSLTFSYPGQDIKDNVLINENKGGLVQITATLSEVSANDVTFSFLHRLGTAQINKDFNFQSVSDDPTGRTSGATVTISAGKTQIQFPIVNIEDDLLYESDESMVFFFSNVKGAHLTSSTSLTIIIEDNELKPIIALSAPGLNINADGSYSVSISENNGGIPLQLTLTRSLNASIIDVRYEITQENGANGSDELPDFHDPGERIEPFIPGRLLIPPESQSGLLFSFLINDDIAIEEQETLIFKLISPLESDDANAQIHETNTKLTITINDDDKNAGAINDTGVSTCYNDLAFAIDCDASDQAGFPGADQDGSQSSPNRYFKLDENGHFLNSENTDATCVYDENTQLVWQNASIAYTYNWLNNLSSINGGDIGSQGSTGTNVTPCGGISPCNTIKNQEFLNNGRHPGSDVIGLCDMQNWRLPKLRELMSIMDFSPNENPLLIDSQYFIAFPGTSYWTATPVAVSSEMAWCIHFEKTTPLSHIRQCPKLNRFFVRMVASCDPNDDNDLSEQPC